MGNNMATKRKTAVKKKVVKKVARKQPTKVSMLMRIAKRVTRNAISKKDKELGALMQRVAEAESLKVQRPKLLQFVEECNKKGWRAKLLTA